jgi:cytochrome-b5 reductase
MVHSISILSLYTGMVYNVTAYFEFHPGGEDELIKGAGIDATDLFDSVNNLHKYLRT